MISKNYHITAEQNVALKRLSKKTDKPEVHHVRKAIENYLNQRAEKRQAEKRIK